MILSAPDETTWVGVMRLVIVVREARSIKDKRRVVNKVRDRLRSNPSLSVAIVGHLEHRNRAIIAVAQVSNDPKLLRSSLDRSAGEIDRWVGSAVESHHIKVIRFDDHFTSDSFYEI